MFDLRRSELAANPYQLAGTDADDGTSLVCRPGSSHGDSALVSASCNDLHDRVVARLSPLSWINMPIDFAHLPPTWERLLATGLLVSIRVSSLMLFAPVFSSKAIPVRIKAGFV